MPQNNCPIVGYNRIDIHPSNNGPYYGVDYEDGYTLWFAADGSKDCLTETPKCNTEYQWMVDECGNRIGDKTD